MGRPFRPLDRGVAVQLGDFSLGEQHEIVVELASSVTKDGANVEVLDAVLRYEDGVGGTAHEERIFVGAKSTADAATLAQGREKLVEDAFARAKDAAATLEKIETQRNVQRNNENRPSPVAAPPRPSRAGAPATTMKVDESSPEDLRQQHDKAIRNFQAY